ncbi:hypothetical protein D5086_017120 [Populus alba]|uniref:Uncharacterized protein n=1 Tax=Populus alba TaxID=43335 RepID=A0ACC4BVW5_POPAL
MVTLWCGNWLWIHCHTIVRVSSLSVETTAVEKQDQYCTGPSVNLQEDPMSTEVCCSKSFYKHPVCPDCCKRSKANVNLWFTTVPLLSHVPVCQDCREYSSCIASSLFWSLLWRLMGISPAWLRIYTRLSAGWLLLAGIAYCFGG